MKNVTYLFAIAIFLFAACDSKKQADEAGDSDTTALQDEPVHNTLTEQQKAEGWKLLFNGQNLNGWKFYKGADGTKNWDVVDGTLHTKSDSVSSADIMTVDKYENFDLMFDFKVSQHANSGVMYRVTEEFNEPYLSGPEFQVMDVNGWPDPLTDAQKTGSNYDMNAAPQDNVKPAGEWNTGRIVVNGDHVEHYVNGTKVVEYDFNSDDWKKRKAASKWKDAKGYGMTKSGHIDLQSHKDKHGGEVWYRNIMIRTL
jgi:hypothetical protein